MHTKSNTKPLLISRDQPVKVYREYMIDPAEPLQSGDVINTHDGWRKVVIPDLIGVVARTNNEEVWKSGGSRGHYNEYQCEEFDPNGTIIGPSDLAQYTKVIKGKRYITMSNMGITKIDADLSEYDYINISSNSLRYLPNCGHLAKVIAYDNPLDPHELVFQKLANPGIVT